MGEVKQGAVTAVVDDAIKIPERAGHLSVKEVQRLPKARKGVGLVSQHTAEALRKSVDRVSVPGLTPEQIELSGRNAEAIDGPLNDAQLVAAVLAQANLLLEAEAHTNLRKALTAIRAAEKFDPRIVDAFPALIEYFANTKVEDDEPQK